MATGILWDIVNWKSTPDGGSRKKLRSSYVEKFTIMKKEYVQQIHA